MCPIPRGVFEALAKQLQETTQLAKYEFSPFGTGMYLWLTKADTKYNDGGIFKGDLGLGGGEAEDFKEKIKALCDAAYEAHIKELTEKGTKPAELKKWTVFYPFADDEDDDGKPTGETVFKFRQNQTLKLKDGTEKVIKIGVVDSKNKAINKPVFSGSILRFMFSTRPVVVASTKMVGVRLDFSSAQIRKLQSSQSPQFPTDEGGYSDEDAEHGHNEGTADADHAGGASEGDY